ncbi:MAG: HD domain-containing protein [Thermodesulfobacteriota bacterium]
MDQDRLNRQLAFILEIDGLKDVARQSYLLSGKRRENTAEHSWHLAVMASVLAEYADAPVDTGRVIRMVLIHDIVEIDAGDTYCYDANGHSDKAERENRAADRIFGLLPRDQEIRMRTLWEEFETGNSPEARWARSLDRFMPLLHNFHTGGKSWREHGITRPQVRGRMRPLQEGSEALWKLAESIIDQAVERGYLAP